MDNHNTNIGKLIYRAEIMFTGRVDYGICMESLASRGASLPPAGARFDHTFRGVLKGPEIKGLVDGTDFLYIRPDGTFHIHIHGKIITKEGVNISPFSEGLSHRQEYSSQALIRSSISLFTSSESYIWLNRLQLWAVGSRDIEKGNARIRANSILADIRSFFLPTKLLRRFTRYRNHGP